MPAPKICFDRILPADLHRPQRMMNVGGRLRAVFEFRKRWLNGSTLKVRFLEGNSDQKAQVIEEANRWTQHANLNFEFGDAPRRRHPHHLRLQRRRLVVRRHRREQHSGAPGDDEPRLPRPRHAHSRVRARHRPGPRAPEPGGRNHLERGGGDPRSERPTQQLDRRADSAQRAQQVQQRPDSRHASSTRTRSCSTSSRRGGPRTTSRTHGNDDALGAGHRVHQERRRLSGARRGDASRRSRRSSWTSSTPPASPPIIGQPGEEDVFKFTVEDAGRHTIETGGETDVFMKPLRAQQPDRRRSPKTTTAASAATRRSWPTSGRASTSSRSATSTRPAAPATTAFACCADAAVRASIGASMKIKAAGHDPGPDGRGGQANARDDRVDHDRGGLLSRRSGQRAGGGGRLRRRRRAAPRRALQAAAAPGSRASTRAPNDTDRHPLRRLHPGQRLRHGPQDHGHVRGGRHAGTPPDLGLRRAAAAGRAPGRQVGQRLLRARLPQSAVLPLSLGPTTPDKEVYTCLSHDIVAHETAHAILDGIAPDLYNAISPQSLALHEAIADLTALLLAFRSRTLTRTVLDQTGGSIEKSTAFSAIAEEFGAQRKASGQLRPLRSLLNDRTHAFVGWRPHLAPRAERGLERRALHGHGADARGSQEEDKPDWSTGKALFVAAEQFKRMVLRALDYLPPGEISFADYGRAITCADRAFYPSLGRRTSLDRRGVRAPRDRRRAPRTSRSASSPHESGI